LRADIGFIEVLSKRKRANSSCVVHYVKPFAFNSEQFGQNTTIKYYSGQTGVSRKGAKTQRADYIFI